MSINFKNKARIKKKMKNLEDQCVQIFLLMLFQIFHSYFSFTQITAVCKVIVRNIKQINDEEL